MIRSKPQGTKANATLRLVQLRRRHLRAVMRIEQQVYPRPWSYGMFLSELGLKSSRFYQAGLLGNQLVGYSGLMFSDQEAHITTIAVDPSWYRYKIGTHLMLSMAHIAQYRGAHHLSLEVRVGNIPARSMYTKFGFQPVGIRKNYYPETNEDALVMWTQDINLPSYYRRLAELEASLLASSSIDK
ncbi:MAG: ribosomal protein S18-alanine N-acetyltransferase [Actinobacteria bacterium]|nr:ribosomal protein S18-alanine N-acetyltransferase [Actinomycetota bacterium]MCL6105424.1 ribosomal protein S18-alanine N-acetyltransferase [Actinomycetota bacterium]